MIKKYIKTHLIFLQKRKKHFFHSEVRRKASMLKTKEEAIEFLIKYPVSYYRYFKPFKYKISSDFLYRHDFWRLKDILKLKRSIKLVEKFQFE